MDIKTDEAIVQATAQCLCQKHSFTFSVSLSLLPLEGAICHCNSCRHVTGAMYSSGVPWPGDKDAIQSSALQKHPFSKRLNILFCGECSSTMFWEIQKRDETTGDTIETKYEVFTGVLLHDAPQDWTRIAEHIFVGDTLDGGASTWVHKSNDHNTKRWHGTRFKTEELPDGWPARPGAGLPSARWTSKEPQDIPFRCRCAGVDLVYRRTLADAEYATVAAGSSPGDLPRFVDPASRKPVVGTDACDSCRASFGVEFVHWTFSSLRHVGFGASAGAAGADGANQPPFPATLADLYAAVSAPEERRDPRLGTLAVYCSSEGVKRYFCSRCSACVFYAADARRDVVNIAMGLFESPEGARAEGAFLWLLGGQIRHREDVLGGWREDWLKSSEAGSEAWRRQRDFPEWWRFVLKQQGEESQ